jgi:hypothetical protein
MIEPPNMAGVPVIRYRLDETFDIADRINLAENEWLLYVNYFGLCGKVVDRILDRFSRNRVVIDNAQAFFSTPRDCLATLYSPRKFFGVPDGGYLVTNLSIPVPDVMDVGSIQHCSHLLKRLAFGPESGYSDFLRAEGKFAGQEPKRMSALTSRLLSSINYDEVNRRRNENFRFLHNELGNLNALHVDFDGETAALCYPFRLPVPDIREKLIRERIFVPCYWPEVEDGKGSHPELEKRLAREILPLPCDQRYPLQEMMRIRQVLLSAIS